jgi:hypothetical protein
MITPRDIVNHLRAFLPSVTDLFHNSILSTGVTQAGGVVTVDAVAHGLIPGQVVIVVNGVYENQIASAVVFAEGVTRFTTTDQHDLVVPKLPEDPQTLTLSGLGAPWDGVFQIDSVPNRETFEIVTPTGETVPPVITTGQLVEQRAAGIVGRQLVATVPTVDQFTINVPSDIPSLPTGNVLELQVLTGTRVVGAADFSRAEAVYTSQPATEAYLFVIMDDAAVSKDRHSLNDSIASFTPQNLQKQNLLQNFTVAVFMPTAAGDTAAFNAQSTAYSEIFQALLNVLYGFRFDDPTTAERYVTVSTGHGPGVNANNTGYYSHVYEWQVPSVITFEEGFGEQATVAFRDIAATFDLFGDPQAQLSVNIDLDEEAV